MKIFLPLCAVIAVAIAACNNVGSCPSSITPGGSCSGDKLTCPYTITSQSSSATCQPFNDGGPVATSCTCTEGTWVCPSCGDDGGGGGDATIGDGEADGGGDSTVEEGGEASVEAGPEASVEAGPEASVEASTETGAETSTEASVDSSSVDSSGGDAGDAGHD